MPEFDCEAVEASDDRDDEGVRLRCCCWFVDVAKYELVLVEKYCGLDGPWSNPLEAGDVFTAEKLYAGGR